MSRPDANADPKARLRLLELQLERERHSRMLLERVASAVELPELLEAVAERLRGLALDGCLINLLDDDCLSCEFIRLPDAYASVEETYRGYRFPLSSREANAHVYASGEPLCLGPDEVRAFPDTTATRFERWAMRSLVVLPLRDTEGVFGTVMGFSCERELSAETVRAMQEPLTLLVGPLRNALAVHALRRREHEVREAASANCALLSFIEEVNNLSGMASVLELITTRFLEQFPFDLAAVLLEQDNVLAPCRIAVRDGAHAPVARALESYFSKQGPYTLDQADGASPTVLAQDIPLFFPDVQEILHLPMSARDRGGLELMGRPRSFYLLPIRSKQRPIGVLWLISLREPVPLGAGERELVQRVASFVGTAIANAGLYSVVERQSRRIEQLNARLEEKLEELRVLAYRDGLTGLNNFGAFQTELSRRMSECDRRSGVRELSLAIVDVDHFKQFNDRYGHLAGNLVLQQVAERIRTVSRRMDVPCRYGGEEFVIILPKCDLEGAQQLAERLRAEIGARPFEVEGEALAVTVSVGCTTYQRGESLADFLKRADKALYAAKDQGRDRVVVAPAPGT